MKAFTKKEFLKKYQKAPIVEFPNSTPVKPKVSVLVITYNHEKYIKQCLEGVINQITDFDYEILLGEDDSTDNTRAICKEYAKKYPEKIKLFLHSRENNIIVYGQFSPNFNVAHNILNAKGEYFTFCEGDDYWLDPYKLQKQIDFLDKNKDYGLIYSDIQMINSKDEKIETGFYKKLVNKYKSGNVFWNLIRGNFINTLTVCVRRELIYDFRNKFNEKFSYDFRAWLHVATYTKFKYIDQKWAAYRVHELGLSRAKDYFKKRTHLVMQSAVKNYLKEKKHIDYKSFSEVIFSILNNKNLTLAEKKQTIFMIFRYPKVIFYLGSLVLKKMMRKIRL